MFGEPRKVASKFNMLFVVNHRINDQDAQNGLKRSILTFLKTFINKYTVVSYLKTPESSIEYPQRPSAFDIDGIIVNARWEIAPSTEYPHWHVNIQFNHRTRIHIDQNSIRRDFMHAVGPLYSDYVFFRSHLVRAIMDGWYFDKHGYAGIQESQTNRFQWNSFVFEVIENEQVVETTTDQDNVIAILYDEPVNDPPPVPDLVANDVIRPARGVGYVPGRR